MTTATDVVSLLREDHKEARELLARVSTSSGDDKQAAFQELVYELARHETAEEEVVYPVLRRDASDGDALADARIHEEEKANKLLADLEKMDPRSTEFDKKFETLRKDVLAHAAAEETEVFPRLQQMEDTESLQSMGRLLEVAKKTAPTHPHPNVPGTAKANLAAGPLAAVVDRTRDAIRDARQKMGG